MRRMISGGVAAMGVALLMACGGGGGDGKFPFHDETPRAEQPGNAPAPVLVAMLMEFAGATYHPADYRSPYLDTAFDPSSMELASDGTGSVTVEARGQRYTVDVYVHPETDGFWTRDPAVSDPTDRTLWIRWDPAA